jgi:Spy/CpxP family protein refolding chaperone
MNRIRLLAIATALAFALPAIAQGSATEPARHLPTVDQHLKGLSEKLDLTAVQQEKARPILKEMQDTMQKVMNDKSLTPEQMHEQMRPARLKADKEMREFLTDEQKKKLDDLESHPHSDPHGQQ